MADEEEVEAEEEAGPAGAEFVPEQSSKARSDVFTLILILTFVAFLGGCILSGREAWEHYDVQFWVFNKGGKAAALEAPPPSATPVNAPPTEPGTPAPPPGTPPPPPK